MVRDEVREAPRQGSNPEHMGPHGFNNKDFGLYCQWNWKCNQHWGCLPAAVLNWQMCKFSGSLVPDRTTVRYNPHKSPGLPDRTKPKLPTVKHTFKWLSSFLCPTCLQPCKFSWNYFLNYIYMNLCIRVSFWRTNLRQEATRVLCEMWHDLFNKLKAEPLTFLKIYNFKHHVFTHPGFFPKK